MKKIFSSPASKKKWLRRLIYCAVVAGTAGFAFYQYKQSQKTALLEEKKDLVFPSLEPSQISSFSIENQKESFHVFRQGDAWRIDSPVKDLADADLVGNWLENLLAEKTRVLKEDKVDWEEYDLDQNIKSIKITKKSKEELKLDISNYSAFDGRFYIRKREKLLLGNLSWANLVSKSADYFRSYKLLNKNEHPQALVYHSRLFKAQLKWENYHWKWKKNATENILPVKQGKSGLFPLSQSDLESYWSALSKVGFEKESYPNTQKFRKKFKLNKASLELQLKFKEGKKWSVKIGPKIKGKFYALVSARDYIFALSTEQRKKILLTKKMIRDHRQPFQFKKDQLAFIDLKGYEWSAQLKKEKEKWTLLSLEKPENILPDKQGKSLEDTDSILPGDLGKNLEKPENQSLNKDELTNVLNRIGTLSAEKYLGQKQFKKVAHVILKDKAGKLILKLEFSTPYNILTDKQGKNLEKPENILTDKQGKNLETPDKKRVYAISNKGQEVMTLDFDFLKFVFSPDLIQSSDKEKK